MQHQANDKDIRVIFKNHIGPENVAPERLEPFIAMLYEGALAYHDAKRKKMKEGKTSA